MGKQTKTLLIVGGVAVIIFGHGIIGLVLILIAVFG